MHYLIDPEKLKQKLMPLTIEQRGTYITNMVAAIIAGENVPDWAQEAEKPLKKGSAYTEAFEAFWRFYPSRQGVKSGKMPAFKSWQRLVKATGAGAIHSKEAETQLLEICLAALAWQKKTDQWLDSDGKYIPIPTTYLNQRRFEDERPEGEGPTENTTPMDWEEFE